MARILIMTGLILAGIGLIWLLFPRALEWFGNLPGDIRIERGDTRVFIPITSMLIASLVLSGLVNLITWLLGLFSS